MAKTNLISVTEFARRVGLSRTRIHQLINMGRIPGASFVGDYRIRGMWVIPTTAKIRPPKRK